MISQSLLAATSNRAVGVAPYGGAGLKKTHCACGLVPPILLCDIGEGGTGSVLPWIARYRKSSATHWTIYTDVQREYYVSLLDERVRAEMPFKPAPLIDVIHFDNTRYESVDEFNTVIANMDTDYYNSLSVDSLQEFSVLFQTQTKGPGKDAYSHLVNDVSFGWAAVQERSLISLRKIRNYRDSGMVIYLTGSEDIAKDYVRNPMEKREKGSPAPEAYSIRGTVDLPGKLATGLTHIPDILCHVRLMSRKVVWVTEPEALPGGEAWWDAKDRFGRLAKYEQPNIRMVMRKLYGTETANDIYSIGIDAAKSAATSTIA